MPQLTKDWPEAIERNRHALLRIVGTLFAMLGLAESSVSERIERALHTAVLRILRPAEAAIRRLIFVAAKDVILKPRKERDKPKGKIEKKKDGDGESKPKRPLFKLEDPRPPMVPGRKPVRYAKTGPRVISFGPTEPTIAAIFAAQNFQPTPRPQPKPAPIKDGKVNGNNLMRRLQAALDALKNLNREAKRLARWKARRLKIYEKRLIYVNPIRPGPCPYVHEKPRHEVEAVLRECHWLAWEVRGLDTT